MLKAFGEGPCEDEPKESDGEEEKGRKPAASKTSGGGERVGGAEELVENSCCEMKDENMSSRD